MERLLRAFAAMDVEIVVRARNASSAKVADAPADKANW